MPSWIRIRIPNLESESGIRIRNLDPDSEPEYEAGIRIRNPESESGIRIRNPNPNLESESRSTDLIESGSETLLFLDGILILAKEL